MVKLGLQAVGATATSVAEKAAAVLALGLVGLKNAESPECPAMVTGMPVGAAPVPLLPAGPVAPVVPFCPFKPGGP